MAIVTTGRGAVVGRPALSWAAWAALGVGVALTAANLVTWRHPTPAAAAHATDDAAAGSAAQPAVEVTSVTLPAPKAEAAGIALEAPRYLALPAELGVPGRIEANLDHQVQVRPRAAGVVRDVKAELGDTVKKGDVLAVLDSPDVGSARLNLRARQRELATARIEAGFKREVAANVATLVPQLRKNTEPESIDRTYGDKTLGAYRATLLSAYAKYAMAKHEEEKTSGLYRQQIVGEHPMLVATHAREGAQAEFEAAVETARFDASQENLLANQKERQAEAAVMDASQRLRILGVPQDIKALLAEAGTVASDVGQSATEDVTACPVLAPFDGTVIARTAVVSQKADMNDVLFTVADLSTVWVMVNIPESEFDHLAKLKDDLKSRHPDTIRLNATAYPGRTFLATLQSVSEVVDPATRTVPVRAETRNAEGLLKVGMFVRIQLETSDQSKALTVPTGAVVEIEGRTAVFVPAAAKDRDSRTFALHPVKLGRESGGRRVVLSGLAEADPVVTRGAFELKSELILQSQGDDE